MSQLGQAPQPAEHGSFLEQNSVSGRAVEFIETIVADNFATTTLAAGARDTVSISVQLWPSDIDDAAKTVTNLIPPSRCIVFYYTDFFIDTNDNFAYEMAVGSSLSAGQAKVGIAAQWDEKTPDAYSSQRRLIQLVNNDSSQHTVYTKVTIKYIITA